MSGYINADDRVRAIHFLKKVQPADGKVVRVEEYQSDRYGNGPTTFIWDPNLSAPSRDSDNRIASVVDTYGPGGANEGAWDLLEPVSPTDSDIIIAKPHDNQGRGFDPRNYADSDEAANQAAQYVGNNGGGAVRLPFDILPLNYGTVSVPSNVHLFIDRGDVLVTFDDSLSTKTTEGPGTYIGDTSAGTANLELQKALEVDGTKVVVKRNGANTLTVSTATDATVKGAASHDIASDGTVLRLVYDRGADNWEEV